MCLALTRYLCSDSYHFSSFYVCWCLTVCCFRSQQPDILGLWIRVMWPILLHTRLSHSSSMPCQTAWLKSCTRETAKVEKSTLPRKQQGRNRFTAVPFMEAIEVSSCWWMPLMCVHIIVNMLLQLSTLFSIFCVDHLLQDLFSGVFILSQYMWWSTTLIPYPCLFCNVVFLRSSVQSDMFSFLVKRTTWKLRYKYVYNKYDINDINDNDIL